MDDTATARTGSNSGAASAALYQRACQVMPGGATRVTIWWPPHPPYAVSGKGCRITDADGRIFLDFANNFFSLIHGHAHPEIVAAVQAQAAHGMAFGLPTALDVELAEAICGRGVPGLSQIRFCNSGSEAVMFAIKAARAATGRHKVAKMEGGYHGAYDHVEVSYDSGPTTWGDPTAPARNAYTRGTPPGVLADTVVLPFNQLEAMLTLLEANASDLAAVVLDPLPSRVGLVPGTLDYLQGVQTACRRLGILLIVDEIVCFRLHPKGAQTLFGLQPDFTTLGKIIGGGQPVGAVAGTAEAMAVFDASSGRPVVPHGGTFSANPITMAAGLASLRLLDTAAYAHLDALGEALRARVRAAIAAAGVPAQVTGMGSLFRLHLHDRPIHTYRDAYPTKDEAARQSALFGFLLAHGILTTPNVSGALSTPMTEAEVEEFGAVLEAGLRAVA